ncbi:hypothetical protein JP75_10050 [Devosia riboflavina]|uniref:Uncharacterized protein n=1 Tax=Devosia riboflavina TaxID=46914 RepID=A0A087M2X4_9HYPH|nr:hypothetical protein JP75_10050 [Devosia riboflavina]
MSARGTRGRGQVTLKKYSWIQRLDHLPITLRDPTILPLLPGIDGDPTVASVAFCEEKFELTTRSTKENVAAG